MINWIVELLKSWLGHWLLAEEEAERQRVAEERLKADEEKRQQMRDIVNQDYPIQRTISNLEDAEF
jgi:hypothetical protein